MNYYLNCNSYYYENNYKTDASNLPLALFYAFYCYINYNEVLCNAKNSL